MFVRVRTAEICGQSYELDHLCSNFSDLEFSHICATQVRVQFAAQREKQGHPSREKRVHCI
jgi:hypothetical protein